MHLEHWNIYSRTTFKWQKSERQRKKAFAIEFWLRVSSGTTFTLSGQTSGFDNSLWFFDEFIIVWLRTILTTTGPTSMYPSFTVWNLLFLLLWISKQRLNIGWWDLYPITSLNSLVSHQRLNFKQWIIYYFTVHDCSFQAVYSSLPNVQSLLRYPK